MKKTKLTLITIVMMLSVIAMAWPILSWADEGSEHGTGYIQPDVDINYVNNTKKLLRASQHAASYDPRGEDWYKNNIVTKNQKSTGLCWAFSTTTAAEISYLKQNGVYTGELSPGHLGYFAYNRSASLSDPLGNTTGDSTYVNSTIPWYNIGGNSEYAIQTLANWLGLASESIASSSWVANPSNFVPYNNKLAYYDAFVLKNAEYLYKVQGNSIDDIKTLIETYGAVTCAIVAPKLGENCTYVKNNEYALYDKSYEVNHAVTIIGWDDNYSKDNFNPKNKPSGDGAWLVQNSWGKWSAKENNIEYIWVSYYDANVNDDIAAFEITEKTNIMYNFQYDGGVSTNYKGFNKGAEVANIYKVPSTMDPTLKTVGFTEWNEGRVSYTVKIYTNLTNASNPTSGTLVTSQTVSTEHAGYHTFDLDNPVMLQAGTKFAIVIEFKALTYFGIDQTNSETSSIRSIAATSKNQSLYRLPNASSWTDGYPSTTFRIKGITEVDGLRVTVKGYTGSKLNMVLTDENKKTYTANTSPYTFSKIGNGTYTLDVSADGDYIPRKYENIEVDDYSNIDAEIRQLGDTNCDGEYTADDVTIIARHIAKLNLVSDPYVRLLCNTNRDAKGKISAADATRLARIIAGIIK